MKVSPGVKFRYCFTQPEFEVSIKLFIATRCRTSFRTNTKHGVTNGSNLDFLHYKKINTIVKVCQSFKNFHKIFQIFFEFEIRNFINIFMRSTWRLQKRFLTHYNPFLASLNSSRSFGQGLTFPVTNLTLHRTTPTPPMRFVTEIHDYRPSLNLS